MAILCLLNSNYTQCFDLDTSSDSEDSGTYEFLNVIAAARLKADHTNELSKLLQLKRMLECIRRNSRLATIEEIGTKNTIAYIDRKLKKKS